LDGTCTVCQCLSVALSSSTIILPVRSRYRFLRVVLNVHTDRVSGWLRIGLDVNRFHIFFCEQASLQYEWHAECVSQFMLGPSSRCLVQLARHYRGPSRIYARCAARAAQEKNGIFLGIQSRRTCRGCQPTGNFLIFGVLEGRRGRDRL